MDLQQQLAQLRDWGFSLDTPAQRWMWSILAVLAAYVAGSLVSRLVRFTARRLSGLAKPARTGGAGAAGTRPADLLMIDILGLIVRAGLLAVGLAVAANLLIGYSLEDARHLAIAALKGLALLVAVWFLGSWLGSRITSFGARLRAHTGTVNDTLFSFLAGFVRACAFVIGLVAALQQFGFDTASLLAVVGAAGLAIALALQDTLRAVAAGVMIAVFRPFRIGDYVEISGQSGAVAEITPFTTVLTTVDNRTVVVTNDKVWGSVIVNSSSQALRRLDLLVSIDYGDDIDRAIAVIGDLLKGDPRVRQDKPVWVKVVDLADSAVNLRARAWVANDDWWDLRCDMLKGVKQGFDRAGLTIPYPHQVTVVKGGASEVGAADAGPLAAHGQTARGAADKS